MGRPKKAAPAEIEPEEISQEFPEEEEIEEIEEEEDGEEEGEAEQAPASSGKVSKADVCRAALAEGIDTTEDALSFARSRYGMEIKASDFILYKSKEKKKQGGAPAAAEPAKRGRKPKEAAPAAAQPPTSVDGYVAPPPKPTGSGSELLDAMEAMKPLVASLGKEQVKRIVELLG